MTEKQIERLVRSYLLPAMPGFKVHRDVLYCENISTLLRGFCFDRSQFNSRLLWVWVFVQPLYVQWASIRFNCGGRLGNLSGGQERAWEVLPGEEAATMQSILNLIYQEGFPFISRIASPRDLADYWLREDPLGTNFVAVEDAVTSLVVSEDYSQATALLDRAECIRLDKTDDLSDWAMEIRDRLLDLRCRVESNPGDARAMLLARVPVTLAALPLAPARCESRGE